MNNKIAKAIACVTVLTVGLSSVSFQENIMNNNMSNSEVVTLADVSDVISDNAENKSDNKSDESDAISDNKSDNKNDESDAISDNKNDESDAESDNAENKSDNKNDESLDNVSDTSKNTDNEDGSNSSIAKDNKTGIISGDKANKQSTPLAVEMDESKGGSVIMQAEASELKYFPITMYNYDYNTINNPTHYMEVMNSNLDNFEQWQGFYFNNLSGNPYGTKFINDVNNLKDGRYMLISKVNNAFVGVKKNDYYNPNNTEDPNAKNEYILRDSTVGYMWNIDFSDDGTTCTLQDDDGQYLNFDFAEGTVSNEPQIFEVQVHRVTDETGQFVVGVDNAIELSFLNEEGNRIWLNNHGARDEFSGWSAANADNAFYVFKLDEDVIYDSVKVEPQLDGANNAFFEDGEYILYNTRSDKSLAVLETEGADGTTTYSLTEHEGMATSQVWTVKKSENGNYYTIQDETGKYLSIFNGGGTVTEEEQLISFVYYEGAIGSFVNNVVIGSTDGYYINDYWGDTQTYFGGYNVQQDNGNAFSLFKKEDIIDNATEFIATSYAPWDNWTGGPRITDGIVKDTLDVNGDVQFNYIQSGIFDTNNKVKDIYTNVGMPFMCEDEDGDGSYTYTFDSNEISARFNGAPTSNTNLVEDTELQYRQIGDDQLESMWMPFDEELGVVQNGDYHFGMKATIPFTMTGNGRINPTDDESAPIEFSFMGDDDIWIFVDGQLVLDLGGIHDRVGATINFAENEWYLHEGSSFVSEAATSGQVFNENGINGKINQTIGSFSATETHELTIFYLERGMGSSNCRISFNFPMKDYVSVTKKANQSYTVENGNVVINSLTSSEQEMVNNVNFGFTLYKSITDEQGNVTNSPVANANYSLVNENGQTLDNPSTDANGHFYLKNGQSARFITDISSDTGETYYVVEDAISGFSQTKYSYAGDAKKFVVNNNEYPNGTDINGTNYIPNRIDNPIQSDTITVFGGTDTNDSLQFICENFYDASMPNGTLHPQEDIIVIDYGLGVKISPLVNDIWRGESIRIASVTGAKYGTATIDSTDNKVINYQLTKQLSDIEILTYKAIVNPDITGGEGVTGTIYIVPATSMYYEEDFGSMVTYTNSSKSLWIQEGSPLHQYQEPGVVGTIGDSPYGSDMVYLADNKDSNGTSKYLDTKNGAAQFSYEFVGTGTSFFTRTNSNTGYMRVQLERQDATSVGPPESVKPEPVNILAGTTVDVFRLENWISSFDHPDSALITVDNFLADSNTGESQGEIYKRGISVTSGKTYKISFDVTSDKNKNIRLCLMNNEDWSLNPYFINEVFTIPSGNAKTVEVEFTPAKDLIDFEIYFGAFDANENGTYNMKFSNLSITEVQEETIDTSTASNYNLLSDSEWTNFVQYDGYNIVDKSTETNLAVSINDFYTDREWNDDSKWQGQAKLWNVPVEIGKTYRMSFNMKATPSKKILAQVREYTNDNDSIYHEEIVYSTKGYYEMEFTAARPYVNVTIAFGAMDATEIGTYDIELSNISLVDADYKEAISETSFIDTVYKNDGTLYNIPVYNREGLPYGRYLVTVTVAAPGKLGFGSDFWLDGIRVYNPLGVNSHLINNYPIANTAYSIDSEANNTVVTIRNKLLRDNTTDGENGEISWNGGCILFTDSNGEIVSADEYKSFGPKQEVYLNDGQSISFTLKDWDANTNRVYLGMKAPKGTGTVEINGVSINISNTVDCYYVINPSISEINGKKYANFEIKVGEGSLISLTNLKVTGTTEFAIYEFD